MFHQKLLIFSFDIILLNFLFLSDFFDPMNDSFLKSELKLSLSWHNISLIDKATNVRILNNLSGNITSGQLLTIMGPSGAGKSSLLSILTSKLSSYASNFNIHGKVFDINIIDYSQWYQIH
jgi:ABC-type transport system involved in cytochrome bd biosynthesis fused ATPase/permease subunit